MLYDMLYLIKLLSLAKKIKYVFLALLILALFTFALFFFILKQPELSEEQEKLIDLWGYPDQFVITYLPRGDIDSFNLV